MIMFLCCAALLALAGADEASEDEGSASSEESSVRGASEHAKTVTLFPDFPDKRALASLTPSFTLPSISQSQPLFSIVRDAYEYKQILTPYFISCEYDIVLF
jgi:hypothetical protein